MLAHRRPMLLLAVVVVAAVTMAALVTGGRETHVVVGGAALDRLVERLLALAGRAFGHAELAEAGDRDIAPDGELTGDHVKHRGSWP